MALLDYLNIWLVLKYLNAKNVCIFIFIRYFIGDLSVTEYLKRDLLLFLMLNLGILVRKLSLLVSYDCNESEKKNMGEENINS